jgi:hypothetical protein
MTHGHKGHLNTSNTFPREVFFSQIQIFPFQFLINSRNLGLGDELTKSSNQRC